MAQPCTVLIAPVDVLPSLKEQASIGEGDILAFADADALRALETITSRKPRVVALERQFASTTRGAALINRIKVDPALKRTQIRVVSADAEFTPVPRRSGAASSGGGARVSTGAAVAAAPVQPLDQRGTRRAPRFKVAGQVNVIVDGNQAALIDISAIGIQVVSTAVLKPNQRFHISLTDESGDIRLRAAVAWASFEISANGPRYRAGIEFLETNPGIPAYIERHKLS